MRNDLRILHRANAEFAQASAATSACAKQGRETADEAIREARQKAALQASQLAAANRLPESVSPLLADIGLSTKPAKSSDPNKNRLTGGLGSQSPFSGHEDLPASALRLQDAVRLLVQRRVRGASRSAFAFLVFSFGLFGLFTTGLAGGHIGWDVLSLIHVVAQCVMVFAAVRFVWALVTGSRKLTLYERNLKCIHCGAAVSTRDLICPNCKAWLESRRGTGR